LAAADLTTRLTCRAFANRVNSRSRSSTFLRPRNRFWSGFVAGHDHLEVLVELDVALPVLALGVAMLCGSPVWKLVENAVFNGLKVECEEP
jgi:hypothetical protein